MARQFLTNLDLAKNELQNARVHNLASAPGSPVAGQIYYDSVVDTLYFYDGTTWVDTGAGGLTTEQVEDIVGAMVTTGTMTGIVVSYDDGSGTVDFILDSLDLLPAPAADVDFAGFKLTNVGTPSAGTDAANKSYVDSAINGFNWKDKVRVATTVAGTLATSFENGDTVDGVTLATNDRILIKNQASGQENGIYIVQASGAPVRSSDADSAAEVLQLAVLVSEGTTNADSAWVNTTNAPITLNTTPLVFVQFGAGASYTAGAGLTLTGNDFSVNVDDVTLEIVGDDLQVKDGGITAAKLADTYSKKYSADIGDGVATTIVVTHSLGTRDVVVSVHDNTTPWAEVYPEVRKTSTTTVSLVFSVAPTSAQYRVSVIG